MTEKTGDGPQSCPIGFWPVYVHWHTAYPARPAWSKTQEESLGPQLAVPHHFQVA